MRHERQSGFSLIELMVAMVVTLIVTGAIYGLLTGGQNAFRREPELSDRQQNIRIAMDLIMRDIASAGAGMPDFIQTFTRNLDGPLLGSCKDSAGAAVTCPVAPSGVRTDELELMGNPSSTADEQACGTQGTGQSHAFMAAGMTSVKAGQVVMIVMDDGSWTMRNIVDADGTSRTGSDRCDSGVDHRDLSFNAGNADTTGFNLPGGLCAGNKVTDADGKCIGCTGAIGTACCSPDCAAAKILSGEIVRYRIRRGADGVPNLERFSSGSSSNFLAGGTQVFQVVARGIEDLQVRYTDGNGNVTTNAPAVDQRGLNFGSLIQTVEVTLSARSEAQNVAGMQSAAAGQPTALRGALTSVGSPRATIKVLGTVADKRPAGWVGPTPWN